MVLSCMGFCCGCGCGTAFSRTVIGWFAFHCVLGHCTIDPSKFNEYQRRNWRGPTEGYLTWCGRPAAPEWCPCDAGEPLDYCVTWDHVYDGVGISNSQGSLGPYDPRYICSSDDVVGGTPAIDGAKSNGVPCPSEFWTLEEGFQDLRLQLNLATLCLAIFMSWLFVKIHKFFIILGTSHFGSWYISIAAFQCWAHATQIRDVQLQAVVAGTVLGCVPGALPL